MALARVERDASCSMRRSNEMGHMKPRFEVERNLGKDSNPPPTLVDPEAYDASEQQFAASLEEKSGRSKFVVSEPSEDVLPAPQPSDTSPQAESDVGMVETQQDDARRGQPPGEAPDAWREELQAKLSQYRARKRPRAPRYPSLQLKFEGSESSWSSRAAPVQPESVVTPQPAAPAAQDRAIEEGLQTEEGPGPLAICPEPAVETGGNLLEFPYLPAQAPPRDELAEPVFDQPRIVEAPEILPPPPALGGILIEPPEEQVEERRPGLDLPLQGAAMSKRLLASITDGLLVLVAGAVFAYIFFKLTSSSISVRHAISAFGAVSVCFWIGYQYLLLVYAGTSPGLKLAGLRLSRFDGRPAPQRLRRWRVLASALSALSLALGYAWCFFDEDQLCWHDRITRTYMAPEIRTSL